MEKAETKLRAKGILRKLIKKLNLKLKTSIYILILGLKITREK